MKKYFILLLVITACSSKKDIPQTDEQKIMRMLDDWHKAAARANFNEYFDDLTDDSIFMGNRCH